MTGSGGELSRESSERWTENVFYAAEFSATMLKHLITGVNRQHAAENQESYSGGEIMYDIERRRQEVYSEIEKLREAYDAEDHGEAEILAYSVAESIEHLGDALEDLEGDYMELTDATHESLVDIRDELVEVKQDIQEEDEDYQNVVASLETAVNEAEQMGISPETERQIDRNQGFINAVLGDEEEEE